MAVISHVVLEETARAEVRCLQFECAAGNTLDLVWSSAEARSGTSAGVFRPYFDGSYG
jgi:hypothetical protein